MTGLRTQTVLATVCGCLAAGPASGQRVEMLGALPGRDMSAADDVSRDGSVVVGKSWIDGVPPWLAESEAFRWTQPGGMVGLGLTPDNEGMAFWPIAISADGGMVVGGERFAFVQDGFFYSGTRTWLWDEAVGVRTVHVDEIDFTTGFGDSTSDWATAVSMGGSVIAGHAYPTEKTFRLIVYRLSADGRLEFLFEPGEHGFIETDFPVMSDDGRTIAGRVRTEDGTGVFVWRDGVLVDSLVEGYGEAHAISADGRTVAGFICYEVGGCDVFVWREGEGFELFSTVPGTELAAYWIECMNAAGTVWLMESAGGMFVVGPVGPARELFAFVEEAFGLDLPGGFDAWRVRACSDDGRVLVGVRLREDGESEAFRLELPWICPGDFSEDGFVDHGDIGVFVEVFLGRTLRSDLNGDGVVDNGDVVRFVEHLAAGC